ncbi:hypothetical protein [Caulobacter sp. 17J65-9]|uniref:hypothetical protein n=1 Tax=Caulobacter sp. 17J65-9 TaxID=2709382 RepID=UPI0013CC26DB|nr:hypothetical protein [Caulobacter sp. 17J65-9]NEX93418.1 hypothetical protein [Caulobacter sp. 17J65-9]
MRIRLTAAVAAAGVWLAVGSSAVAQTADPTCLELTERLRGQDFVGADRYGRVDYFYRLWIADRATEARRLPGPEGLRENTIERLGVTCAASPREALQFLVRTFAADGDLDGARQAAQRQVEIAANSGALENARRDLAMVLVARGDEAGALVEMRRVRAELSDPALLMDAYEWGAAGSMIFGYGSPTQLALLEGAARNGRLRLTQPRQSWETPEVDLAQALSELGERRRNRGEGDKAVGAYAEATALLAARAEELRRKRPFGWETELTGVEDLLSEAYTGLTESAAAKGDRAQTVKAAEAGVALFAGQKFAAPGSGIAGQIASRRFSGDATARPAAKRLERTADALLVVDEAGFAARLYEAEANIFAEDPSRVADLGRAYTRLASARRMQGDLAGAGEAVELAGKALAYGVSGERRSVGPSSFSSERAALLLEKAQISAAQGDRDGACRMLDEATGLLPRPNDWPEDKKVAQGVAAVRASVCPTS